MLAKDGWSVSGISRGPGEAATEQVLSTWLPSVDLHFGDLASAETAAAVCADVEAVIFAAGTSGVERSFQTPQRSLQESALPWLSVLGACRPNTRLILLSSQLVYGPSQGYPFCELDRPNPKSPYALHRHLMEEYGRMFGQLLDLDVAVLRLGNVWGEIIDIDFPRTHGLVAKMLHDLLSEGTIKLFGDGKQTVDMLHVADLAEVIGMVLEGTPSDEKFTVFNIHGEQISLRDVAQALRQGFGSGVISYTPWPPDLRDATANNIELDGSRFRQSFGWTCTTDMRAELRSLAARLQIGQPSRREL